MFQHNQTRIPLPKRIIIITLLILVIWLWVQYGYKVTTKTATSLLGITSPSTSSRIQDLIQHPSNRPLFVQAQEEYSKLEDPFPEMPFTAYDPVSPKPGMKVPNIVHYIWFDKDGDLHMTFSQYLAIRSVIVRQKAEKIYMHCNTPPNGVWWDAIKDHIVVNHLDVPETIYGHPIYEYTHRSDIFRILILQKMGGIYLDIDIFLVKELDDLMYAPYTMGEGWPGLFWSSVILSEPHAPFLEKFKNAYRDFNPGHWWETSSEKPAQIASLYPGEVQVVDHMGFFWPDANHMEIHETDNDWYDFFETGQYTYHGWNHHTGWQALERINPKDVLERNTSFNRMVRVLVSERDVEIWDSITDPERYHDKTHA